MGPREILRIDVFVVVVVVVAVSKQPRHLLNTARARLRLVEDSVGVQRGKRALGKDRRWLQDVAGGAVGGRLGASSSRLVSSLLWNRAVKSALS